MCSRYYTQEEQAFTRRYRFSIWWISHREQVRRRAFLILGILEGCLILFFLWTMADSFLISGRREQAAVIQMVTQGQEDLRAYATSTRAKDLELGRPVALASGEGRYDLYAPVSNPNTAWYARLRYTFTSDAGETREASALILPGASAYPLTVFAVPASGITRDLQLNITALTWERVDAHAMGPYDDFARDRLNFVFENIVVDPTFTLDNKIIGRITFTVKNFGSYGYYNPAFYLILQRGNGVVGIHRTTLSSLGAGETQEVVVNWFGTIPDASKVLILPDIDIFDPQAYQPLKRL